MFKMRNYSSFIVLIMLLQFVVKPLLAQQDNEMLIFQIDGNTYEKKSYDKKGKLSASQVFVVGKIKLAGQQYVMPLKVYLYDKNGELKDSLNTKYTCNPSNKKVLMNIFSFADFSSDKTVKVDLHNGDFYPTKVSAGNEFADIEFSLSIEGGMAGAFGSSSKVKIYERKITGIDTPKDTYTISSKIEIKAYAFGIRLTTLNYVVSETINKQRGILEQSFKEDTGEYFTIKLIT